MTSMVILFSMLLCIGVTLNILLALMTRKLKRVKEQEKQNIRRHLDVLYTANASVDVIGSLLCYSICIFIYKRNEMDEKACTVLGTFVAGYITSIAVVTSTINLHVIYSCTKPFKFHIYLKTRTTRIPHLCIFASLLFGVISIILTASGHPKFLSFKSIHFYAIGCKLDQESPALYYYALLIYQTLGVGVVTLVILLYASIKRSRKWPDIRKNACRCSILPVGVPFKIAYVSMYLLSWTPCAVVMTIVMSGQSVSHEVILSSCYAMFVPSLLLPIVSYVSRKELREIFKRQFSTLMSTMKCRRPGNEQGLTISNKAVVKDKN